MVVGAAEAEVVVAAEAEAVAAEAVAAEAVVPPQAHMSHTTSNAFPT